MKLSEFIITSVIAAMAFSSCEPADPEHEPMPIQYNLSKVQEEMVNEGNNFSFNLLKAVSADSEFSGKDFMVSPLGISFVLGALNNGASGETSDEILSTLGFNGCTTDDINEYCRTILQGCQIVDDKVSVKIADAVVVKEGYDLKEGFSSTLTDYYDAYVRSMKFDGNAIKAMNDWCNEQTEGMIPKIIEKIPESVCMFTLNSIYFKGEWAGKFEKKNTEKEEFTNIDGTTSMTEMMHQEAMLCYSANETWSTVCLPYGNGSYNMYVLLPKEGKGIDDILSALDGQSWESMKAEMRTSLTDLKIPRFETKTSINLVDIMKSLGIRRAFDPYNAEFGEMFTRTGGNVSLGILRQENRIIVNEEGTEAASVTIGGSCVTSVGPSDDPEPVIFHADRPFVYIIQEKSSNAIFFIGTKVRS